MPVLAGHRAPCSAGTVSFLPRVKRHLPLQTKEAQRRGVKVPGVPGSQWWGQASIQLFPARACVSRGRRGHRVTSSRVREVPGAVDWPKDVTGFLCSTDVVGAPSWCRAWALSAAVTVAGQAGHTAPPSQGFRSSGQGGR